MHSSGLLRIPAGSIHIRHIHILQSNRRIRTRHILGIHVHNTRIVHNAGSIHGGKDHGIRSTMDRNNVRIHIQSLSGRKGVSHNKTDHSTHSHTMGRKSG